MKTIKSPEAIGQFLLSILPDQTRMSYELLAGLDYPLNDYASLAEQLKQQRQGWEAEQCEAADNILTHLTPLDFPIVSVQGALEKYHVRLPFPDLSRFFPLPQPFPEPVREPEVPVWREYLAMFGPECAREAYEMYLDSLKSGFPEPVAYYNGIIAGRRC